MIDIEPPSIFALISPCWVVIRANGYKWGQVNRAAVEDSGHVLSGLPVPVTYTSDTAPCNCSTLTCVSVSGGHAL